MLVDARNASNTSNASSVSQFQKEIHVVLAVLSYVMLFGLQFGISCATNIDEIVKTWSRNWSGVAVAFGGQALLMPALAYALSKFLGLNDLHTLGLLLIGCCPGGTLSNALVYFARAVSYKLCALSRFMSDFRARS